MADRPGVPEQYSNEREHRRTLARKVNELALGRTNNVVSMSLEVEPATETELDTPKAELGQVAVLSPQDAGSAADQALGTTWVEVTTGKVTVHHAASAIARSYGVILQG